MTTTTETPITIAFDACVIAGLLTPGESFPGGEIAIRALAERASKTDKRIEIGLLALADSLAFCEQALALPPGEGRMPLLSQRAAKERDAARLFRDVIARTP
jgi:hypothetical protein